MKIDYKGLSYGVELKTYLYHGIEIIGMYLHRNGNTIKVQSDIPPLDSNWITIDTFSYPYLDEALLRNGIVTERVTTIIFYDKQYPVYEIDRKLVEEQKNKR